MSCAICEVRKPRRYCPGVRGEICSVCCGTEREVSVACPFDCVYLQEARKHEKRLVPAADDVPNHDIRVTEEFLRNHEDLLVAAGRGLVQAALETPGAVDNDVRDALSALIRTFRSLESGVYYETRPSNPVAGNVCALLQQAFTAFRDEERKRSGLAKTRDTDVLGVLVFLERLAIDRNNGRPRGRAFIDFMRTSFGTAAGAAESSPLIAT